MKLIMESWRKFLKEGISDVVSGVATASSQLNATASGMAATAEQAASQLQITNRPASRHTHAHLFPMAAAPTSCWPYSAQWLPPDNMAASWQPAGGPGLRISKDFL